MLARRSPSFHKAGSCVWTPAGGGCFQRSNCLLSVAPGDPLSDDLGASDLEHGPQALGVGIGRLLAGEAVLVT
jgi:hypothetical protein